MRSSCFFLNSCLRIYSNISKINKVNLTSSLTLSTTDIRCIQDEYVEITLPSTFQLYIFLQHYDKHETYMRYFTLDNDDMLEIKVEPAVQSYTEVEHGYAEFENSNLIPSTADVGALNLWTSKATSCLITQYKKYRSMVGQTTRMKSLREMFEMVSLEMQKYGFYFSAQKCENKWRVLERKYKNLVYREKLKKPGRMRHYGHWEHKIALDEIFDERKRKMYLDDNDYSPPGASNKFTLILPKPGGDSCNNTVDANQPQPVEDPLAGATVNSQSAKESDESEDLRTCLTVMFEKFLARMDKNFITQQQNKERRHKEKMAIRQSELELQKKLFKLKEQKMALKKSQLLAAAQHVHLNME